jgi:hypothetical protein
MSRLKTVDPDLQILPDTTNENLNPISDGKNVPADAENFKKYFTNMSEGGNNITFFARVQTNTKCIAQLKRNQQIFDYLKEWKSG